MTAAADSGTATGVPAARTIVYRSIPGFRPLELDLYLPAEQSGPAPMLLFFHGGGWRVGSRTAFGPAFAPWHPTAFERLAQAGFAVVSVDYRLSAEAQFPAQLDDVRAALAWVAQQAPTFGADPRRIVVWGESAGGHLAAMLALSPPTDGARICGVIDWYGPSDLSRMPEQRRPDAVVNPGAADSRESLLLGAPLLDVPELAAAASPITHVRSEAPPFFLVHGDEDRFVPVDQSVLFCASLIAAGVSAKLTIIPGADHMWRGVADVTPIFTESLSFARGVVGLS